MTPTTEALVPDRLWQAIQPLLRTPPPRYGGQPRVDDRACLAGMVYQLRTGVPLAAGAGRPELSAANTHDSMLLEAMVDAVPGQGPARAAWA
jgi:hypothetical protein